MLTDEDCLICVESVEFVLTEMERFQKLFASGASFTQTFGDGPASLAEFMAKVKHTETGREYTCGREALKHFRKIAGIALKRRFDAKDFALSEVTERLQETFLSHVFLNLDKEPRDYIESWITASVRHVALRHRHYTHYIPCVALQIGEETFYRFGPVIFLRKAASREHALRSYAKYEAARNRLAERARRNAAPGLQWCWERKPGTPPETPEETFEELTAGVEWIAKIRVPKCAKSISTARADTALRAALSSLALLLQGTEGAGLRLGHDPFVPAKTNQLLSVGDSFRPSSSWQFGTPKVQQGWQEYIAAQAQPVVDVMHHLIEQILEGANPSFGFQIALRAMTWYADAVREPNIETRLIKCATAIECLLFPQRGGATATFVIRGSLLAQRQGQPMSDWAPVAKRLYKKRSDVAHGNVDSLHEIRKESIHKELEFTRNVILQFLMFCHQLQPIGTTRACTKEDFVELYRRLEALFHDDVARVVKEYRFKDWKVVPKSTP
jgi:Apea-like HEPN